MGSAVLALLGGGLVAAQFLVGADTPLYPRIVIGLFTLPMLFMSWFSWRTAAAERREALDAWATWPLIGLKGDSQHAPKPVDASEINLREVIAGRATHESLVLVDPKYKFNRRPLEPDFLRELFESAAKS
jgi:hypothetical protein